MVQEGVYAPFFRGWGGFWEEFGIKGEGVWCGRIGGNFIPRDMTWNEIELVKVPVIGVGSGLTSE